MPPPRLQAHVFNIRPHTTRLATTCWLCDRTGFTARLPLSAIASAFRVPTYRSRTEISCRPFSSSEALASGHSRWSKIKHDKAKKDASQTKARSQLARDLAQASKLGGPDPTSNPKLGPLLVTARKIGFTKASTESAIARGQGRSITGASLVGFEWGLMHAATGGVMLVECLTDNKARTMQDLREVVKGTQEASVEWMFERRGRITIESSPFEETDAEVASTSGLDEEAVMEAALGAGALDVDFDDGGADVLTEPTEMTNVLEALESALGRRTNRAELIWKAKDDSLVDMSEDSPTAQQFGQLVERIEGQDGVIAVWTNSK